MKKSIALTRWSFACGIASLIFGILTGFPAIVCGHMSLMHCNKTAIKLPNNYYILTVVGISLGYISAALSLIFLALYIYSGYASLF
jgi:hypothetical protein